MLQILLAADEKLSKAIVGPLEARGCSVRVVRGLSEVVQACAQEPRPQVIAAAFPVSAGGAQAIGELQASAKTRLPPLVVLLPPNRGSEVPALKAAGAAEVFESPLKLNAFLARAKELAIVVPPETAKAAVTKSSGKGAAASAATAATKEPATTSREAALGDEEVGATSAIGTVKATAPVAVVSAGASSWPRTVVGLEACQQAIIAYNTSGETPAGFEKDTLQALFRVMTDVEVRAVKELAAGAPPDMAGSSVFLRVTSQRLRVRQALTDSDRLSANGGQAPVDEAALAEWQKQIDGLVAEVQPVHEKAVTAGDLQSIRQYKIVIDALGRLRRDLENAAERLQGRTGTATGTALIDDHVPPPPDGDGIGKVKEPPVNKPPVRDTRILEIKNVSEDTLKRERRLRNIAIAATAGLAAAIAVIIWQSGVVAPSYEFPQGIPSLQSLEYHGSYTKAIANPDFDVVTWGHELERQAKVDKEIRIMTPQGVPLATLNGDTARLPDGREVKLKVGNSVPHELEKKAPEENQ